MSGHRHVEREQGMGFLVTFSVSLSKGEGCWWGNGARAGAPGEQWAGGR